MRLLSAALLDDAVCRSLDVLIQSYGPDGIGYDVAGYRVLDVGDGSADVGLEGGIFKCPVAGRVESAVLEHEVAGIAQRLFSGDMAVDQPEVAGVPSEIFPV